MDTNVSAKVIYGFIVSNKECLEYNDKCGIGEDTSDYYHYLGSYFLDHDSDAIFGITLQSTHYYCSIDELDYDKHEWEKCFNEWKKYFPNRIDDTPKYFLICEWFDDVENTHNPWWV